MTAVGKDTSTMVAGSDGSIESQVLAMIDHAEESPKYMHQRDRAAICEEFEQGKQWTAEQYARWKEVGIEPITINRCLTTIKALTGMYLDNLQDITVVPRKGGKATAAQVITEVLKHCQDTGDYEAAAFHCFQQGNITTESTLWLDVDKTKTQNGAIQFTSNNFFDVIIDPDCESYDIDDKDNGAKYVIRKIYMDREILKAIWKDKFEGSSTDGRTVMENYIAEATIRSQFYTEEEKTYRSCLYEAWWKEYIPAVLLRDIETGETKVVTEKVETVRRKANKSRRLEAEKTFACVLHRSFMVNGKLMEDKKHPLGEAINFYPCVRYVPIWRSLYNRGILDDLVSLNYEENLRRTQVSRLINLTANSGWKIKRANTQQDLEDLKQYGSVPGVIIEEDKYGGKADKIAPNQLSTGHFNLAQQSATDIREVSGLNSALQGYDESTRSEPGVVLSLRKEQGEAANSSIFKNFRISLEQLGGKLLSMIDSLDIYTESEIRAVVEESNLIDSQMMQKAHDQISRKIGTSLPNPQMPPPPSPEQWAMLRPEDQPAFYEQVTTGVQAAQLYAQRFPAIKEAFDGAVREMAIQMLLGDLMGGELQQYGIKVVLSSKTQTARMRTFEMLMAIQDKYGVIPPDILLEYSDLPNKDEIIARMQAAQAQQAQVAQAARQPRQEEQLQLTGQEV